MLIIFTMYITKDNGKDNLTSGGAHRERTSWLEDSHLFANSDQSFLLPSQTPPTMSSSFSSPANETLEPIPRCPRPVCSSTLQTHKCKPAFRISLIPSSTKWDFSSDRSPSSTKWDVDLSGVWPIVLGTGREAQISSKARAGWWLDAVSCEELFSPQTKTRQRVSMMIGFFFTDGSTLPSSSRVRPGGQAQPSAHRLNRSIILSV